MRASARTTSAYGAPQQDEPIRVWIESEDGAIARGTMGVLSADEAVARLTDGAWLRSGCEVAVRVSPSRSTPTLAARARVTGVRPAGDSVECELAWVHAGTDRERLAGLAESLS
jgi:hypothetical protein